ncbi:Scr1 family TA system antitoxin-like transcriptional regulator, partial [Salinispora arenicola]|uniref:Scr1 family TA system antitoxin-like transcriptional regulator n=1 Tax=Salinispora arenicola TaxID=168697 RepID=UPI003137D983
MLPTPADSPWSEHWKHELPGNGVLDRPGGPTYEVIIDELAIRRHAAPPEVVRAQLDHLINVGHEKQKTTIRVLRLSARIAGNAVPRSSYFNYRYPDPSDPVV